MVKPDLVFKSGNTLINIKAKDGHVIIPTIDFLKIVKNGRSVGLDLTIKQVEYIIQREQTLR